MPEPFTLLINPLSSPVQFALYAADGTLRKSWEVEGYVSECLIDEIERCRSEQRLERILYVNGPGSYMGIKLAYITLRTLEMSEGIPFEGCSAFSLNGARPVKAMGKLYFVKEKETIMTRKYDEAVPQEFRMPESLREIEVAKDRSPDYRMPAV